MSGSGVGRRVVVLLVVGLLVGAGLVVVPGGSVPLVGGRSAAGVVGGLSTLAGSGATGQVDGAAGVASFDNLVDIAVDPSGAFVYVLEKGISGRPNQIRKVSTVSGVVSTFVSGGLLADVDPGSNRGDPSHLKVDASGDVWVSTGLSPSEIGIV